MALLRPDLGELILDTGTLRIRAARHGLMAYPAHDAFVGRSVDLYGDWSPGDAEVLAPYLAPGATVLDVGANIGTLTLVLARAVGAGGRVIAFEPVAASYRLLVTNLALNALAHVEPVQAAVGAVPGHVRVADLDHTRPGNYGAAALDPEGPTRRVERLTVDGLGLAACDVLKADVEGGERDVLVGAAETIRRFRPVLLLENEEPSQSGALIEMLLSLGYELWWHSPLLFEAANAFGCPDDVFPGLGSLNILALPGGGSAPRPSGLRPVLGPDDWPAWWPDWRAQ